MSRGVKIGCGVVFALFVISAAVCGGLYFYAQSYFEDLGQDFADQRPALEASAQKVAAGGPDACVEAGLAKNSQCDDFAVRCRAEASIWTSMCLDAKPLPAAFCEGVPAQTDILEVSMWGLGECEKRGFAEDSNCPQFLAKTVAQACEGG